MNNNNGNNRESVNHQANLLLELRESIEKIDKESPLAAAEVKLAVRPWKQKLIRLQPMQSIKLVKEVSKPENKDVLDAILTSLDQDALISILSVIHHEYTTKIVPEKNIHNGIAHYFEQHSPDDFTQKKHRIRKRLQKMYNDTFDGKFIFWLGIFLMHREKQNYHTFSVWTFWEDIKQWLFTGERVESSFWQHVSNPAPQIVSAKEEKSHEITANLSQS